MSNADFYRAFEDRHRGSRDLIKNRLHVYLPFIIPLKDIHDDCSIIDLGCGRGEWLELTRENGFNPHGVDLDEGMLNACRERGFSVETQDAIAALHQLPDESQTIVSGFHIAEHISFDVLQELIKESLRVLKPAGLLILETPNPENIIVGTSNFYLDPTHKRPLPPLFLSFLPEQIGFFRTKTIRLQEPPVLVSSVNIHLLDVLGGVSPDYAIIAQKKSTPEVLIRFNTPFDTEYGLTLENLATRYDTGLRKQHSVLDARLTILEEKHSTLEDKHSTLEDKHSTLEDKHSALERYLNSELQSIYFSRSWRITAPLRWIGHQTRLVRQQGLYVRTKAFIKLFMPHSLIQKFRMIKHDDSWSQTEHPILTEKSEKWIARKKNYILSFIKNPKWMIRKIAIALKYYINSHPKIKIKIMMFLNYFPSIKTRLKRIEQSHHYTQAATTLPNNPEQLSSYAKKIHRNLNAAIKQSR
jgi:O-antigen chain-terminating methyltransferase